MLNKTIINAETKVCPVTQVIEKSITPDKVTEMYDKVRAEVEKDIVKVMRVGGNDLNGIVVQINPVYDRGTTKIYTKFVMNGKEYQELDYEKGQEVISNEIMFGKLLKHYSEFVALQIMKEGSRELIRLK